MGVKAEVPRKRRYEVRRRREYGEAKSNWTLRNSHRSVKYWPFPKFDRQMAEERGIRYHAKLESDWIFSGCWRWWTDDAIQKAITTAAATWLLCVLYLQQVLIFRTISLHVSSDVFTLPEIEALSDYPGIVREKCKMQLNCPNLQGTEFCGGAIHVTCIGLDWVMVKIHGGVENGRFPRLCGGAVVVMLWFFIFYFSRILRPGCLTEKIPGRKREDWRRRGAF